MIAENDRPPSLLQKRPIETSTLLLGLFAALFAHLGLPLLVLGSQWLLVLLGLAIPVSERERPKETVEIVAAEFVRLGKPFDPTKLPSRKVPPVAKRKTEGVAVSADAKERPEQDKKEEKEKPREYKESALDNLIDRTKEFAEDVEYEQEGDPNGLREGTATEAKAGDIYLGQLSLFFRRNWEVPNVVQDPEKLVAIALVSIADDGRVTAVEIQKGSGDPYFDQSVLDSVQRLIQAGASIPEPPAELIKDFYGLSRPVRFRGSDLR